MRGLLNGIRLSKMFACEWRAPVLTRGTTMWDAWTDFNASHSLGAMLVIAFYIPLALIKMEAIREATWVSI